MFRRSLLTESTSLTQQVKRRAQKVITENLWLKSVIHLWAF